MQTLATVVGFASGFALMGYHGNAANLLATSLIIDASLAPVTVVAAVKRGRTVLPWAILGAIFGIWALATVLVILPKRDRPQDQPPPPQLPSASDAA